MKEIFILVAIYILFFLISRLLYKKSFQLSGTWFYISVIIYLTFAYLYFEGINYAHIKLREKAVYFEFGHSGILLIMTWMLAIITGLILIILAIHKRNQSSSRG